MPGPYEALQAEAQHSDQEGEYVKAAHQVSRWEKKQGQGLWLVPQANIDRALDLKSLNNGTMMILHAEKVSLSRGNEGKRKRRLLL